MMESSLKNMLLSLGIITLVCSALLGVVYSVTKEPIEAAQNAKTIEAIGSVLPQFETLGEMTPCEGGSFCKAFVNDTTVVGYAVNASSTGFGGVLKLMVGFRPDGSISGVSVLSHSETPGLGAKCTDPAFSSQFIDFNPAEKSLSVKKDGGDVDAITASTITSRAYCKALQNAYDIFKAETTIIVEEPKNE